MNYEKGTCAECRQPVLTKNGLAVEHPIRGTPIACEGSGEFAEEREAAIIREIESPPVVVEQAPVVEVPQPIPVAQKAMRKPRALRTMPAAVKPVIEREIQAARERLKRAPQDRGTIDYEKLKDCECPSLRAAIRRFLGEA